MTRIKCKINHLILKFTVIMACSMMMGNKKQAL